MMMSEKYENIGQFFIQIFDFIHNNKSDQIISVRACILESVMVTHFTNTTFNRFRIITEKPPHWEARTSA